MMLMTRMKDDHDDDDDTDGDGSDGDVDADRLFPLILTDDSHNHDHY